MTIRFDDVHAIKLIAKASNIQFVPLLHHCIANYDNNDRILGGVLFTEYAGGSVQIHVASFQKSWISKALLYLTFNYPFNQLKVKKLIGIVPEYNKPAFAFNLHLGFDVEYKSEDIYNYRDLPNGVYFMSMYRENCRFLNMKPPFIDMAPPERTNSIDRPLAYLEPMNTMH